MSRQLAIAALLAAACSSLDLDRLEPKQAGECAAGTKPCGYLCVPKDDPATGCGGASCDPCAVGANEVGVCDAAGGTPTCATACAPDYEDCLTTVPGCETRLTHDAQNCGACGRACFPGDSCNAGVCPPVSADGARSAVNPRDVESIPSTGEVLYVDGGGTGELWSVAETTPRAQGLGDVWRLDADAASAFATGTVQVASATHDVIWQVDATGTVAPLALTEWDRGTSAAPVLLDLAASPTDVKFTVLGTEQVYRSARGLSGEAPYLTAAGPGQNPLAIALAGANLIVGVRDGGIGRVFEYVPATNTAFYHPTLATPADRVAYDPGRKIVYAASYSDGSVWAYDALDFTAPQVLLWRTGQPTFWMDLHVDADGVYWTDSAAGLVMGVRYDTAPPAGLLYWDGGTPVGVTTLGDSIFWTDYSGGVWRAPK